MRAIVLLLLAALAISCHAFEDDLYPNDAEPVEIGTLEEGKLRGFLEKVKQWLKTGHDKPAIPVLDPFRKDHFELALSNKLVTLDAILDDLRATGLSNFDILKADFSIIGIKASIKLNWTDVDLMTKYKIREAKLPGDMSLWGSGTIMAIIQGLDVDVDLSISINDEDKLYVRTIDVKIGLKKLKFDASGLFDDDETSKLLSKIVSEIVPQILVDYQEQVSQFAGDLVKKTLDGILGKLSFSDLIDMITG
ncbi:uncharacterized protein LOC144475027 [Augochlora pura]